MLANETRCWNPMLLLFALLGAFTVAVATCRFGAGISPDSVTYVTVARSLLAGRGFVDWTGAPFVSQPPLFSLALAGAGWLTGIDPLATARLLNAGLFGAIIYAAGFWLLKNVTARVTALVGCTGVAVSVPLFYVSAMAWSEPLFILLCLLFLT